MKSRSSFTAVADIPFRKILGLNQQTYQRLKLSMSLQLRRQIFVAVCDDLLLRDRLANQLQAEINKSQQREGWMEASAHGQDARRTASHPYPRMVSLHLNLNDPNLIVQMAQWLTQFPPPRGRGKQIILPAFQFLGVENLTRQPASIQRLFFTYLQSVERNLPLLESTLLIWVNQPWFHALQNSAPEFWRCRTGIFEFVGEPTPSAITLPERIGLPLVRSAQLEAAPVTSLTSAIEPTLVKTVSIEPNVAEPDVVEPDVVEPDVVEPDIVEPNAIEPDIVELDAAEPDTVEPDVFDLPPIDLPPFDPTTFAAELPSPLELAENPWEQLLPDTEPLFEPETDLEADLLPLETEQLIEPDEALADLEPELLEALTESITAAELGSGLLPADVESTESAEALTDAVLLEGLADRPLIEQIEILHRQNAAPEQLAEAYRSLGNLYRDRIEQGDISGDNLVAAIQAYEQSLVWLPEFSPHWSDVLNDMGNLYWLLARAMPEPTEAIPYLKLAIQAYQLALSKISEQTQAQSYPMVQNNLGAAYADLARFEEPAANLQRSAQAYQEALRYRTPDSDPIRYASTQNNLGTTYWNLAQHQQAAANLKQAIAAYSEALQYYIPEEEPLNYAMIQNNLGTAYWNLAQYERPKDWLLLSLSAYRMALKYRTLDTAPVAFAATQNNLGTAYWHLANYTDRTEDRLDYLRQAITAYETTLKAATLLEQAEPETPPLNFDLFATYNNLGLAHYQLATDLQAGLDPNTQSTHLEQALHHHITAMQGWAQNSDLRQTALNCVIQTMRAFYSQLGLAGQNLALSIVPGPLLPEILPKI